jgi:hypothetical protein
MSRLLPVAAAARAPADSISLSCMQREKNSQNDVSNVLTSCCRAFRAGHQDVQDIDRVFATLRDRARPRVARGKLSPGRFQCPDFLHDGSYAGRQDIQDVISVRSVDEGNGEFAPKDRVLSPIPETMSSTS